MPLFLNEDQQLLQESASNFIAQNAPVSHMRKLRDSKDETGFSLPLWQEFANMGFNGILVGEEDGGLGLGHVEAGIILEQIGLNLTPSPFLTSAIGAVTALNSASSEMKSVYLPKIISGEITGAIATEEGAKHNPYKITTTATPEGNGFKINGKKKFVIHGHAADFYIISARTSGADNDKSGISLFLVEKSANGLSHNKEKLIDSNYASDVNFDNVYVNSDALIGEVNEGALVLNKMLNSLQIGAAAEMVGVGNGAMNMTMNYLKERKQFGKIIGSFQALQHRAAHLYSELEVARAAIIKAQQLLDANDAAAPRAVTIAKAMSGLATTLAVQEGVQMHGGIGMTDEYNIGLYMKRQRVLAEMFGDTDYHTNQLAIMSGY